MAGKPPVTETGDEFEDTLVSQTSSDKTSGDESSELGPFVDKVTSIFGGQILSDSDRFTGGRAEFALEELTPRMLAATSPPPLLPGTNEKKTYNRARGQSTGPLYVSPNIQHEDALWIKLAYMRYPLGRENLIELLGEMLPAATKEAITRFYMKDGSDRRWAETKGVWGSEIAAWRLLQDGNEAASAVQKDFEAVLGTRGRTLVDAWAWLQRLTIFVLWVWGSQRSQAVPIAVCDLLAESVGRLYQNTHPWTYEPLTVFGIEGRKFRIFTQPEGDRQIFRGRTGNEEGDGSYWGGSYWGMGLNLPSVATIVDGLMNVIGTAGATIEFCPNCQRIFAQPDPHRLFCSDYCRTVYNRRRRATGAPSAREIAKKAREEAQARALARKEERARRESTFLPEDWK